MRTSVVRRMRRRPLDGYGPGPGSGSGRLRRDHRDVCPLRGETAGEVAQDFFGPANQGRIAPCHQGQFERARRVHHSRRKAVGSEPIADIPRSASLMLTACLAASFFFFVFVFVSRSGRRGRAGALMIPGARRRKVGGDTRRYSQVRSRRRTRRVSQTRSNRARAG